MSVEDNSSTGVGVDLLASGENTESQHNKLEINEDNSHSTLSKYSYLDDDDNDESSIITAAEIHNDCEEDISRDVWDSKWEFLLSCISMSVGLGNVWRFPITAYNNGGGAFLIPYFIILLVIGRPIYFMELCMGQFSSRSQVQVWKCVPFLTGIGYGAMFAAFAELTYYCALLAISIYYFIVSFQMELPWSYCDEDWAGAGNCDGDKLISTINRSIPDLYFEKGVLKEYPNIKDGIGSPDLALSFCLLAAWVVIYLTIMKGVKSSGKAAYFTALFPYVVLLAMLIRGLTLPGSSNGVMYFLNPNWEKLIQPKVWYAAAAQCFFSLGTGVGSIVMYASYNPFRHNIYRDAIIISFADTFTSFTAGVITFAILGNLAYELKIDVSEVVKGGASLAFISYPDAIAKFKAVPQLFAVLFFMMLFTLGIGSAAAIAQAIASVFWDKYFWMKKGIITSSICVLGFLIGLVYVTPGGQWILDLADFYGGGFLIYTMCTMEVIGISWFYGLTNFVQDVEYMLDIKLGLYWKVCWGVIIPLSLILILIYSFIMEDELKHNGHPYPTEAIVCGWILAGIALSCVPIGAFFTVRRQRKEQTLWKKLCKSLQPDPSWGPRDPKDHKGWKKYKSQQDQRSLWKRLFETRPETS